MDAGDLSCWLRLLACPGIGRVGARRLTARFGPPAAVLCAPYNALAELVGDEAARLLQTPMPQVEALVERTLDWLDGDPSRTVVSHDDASYSPLLRETADPPLLLYAQGRLELLRTPSVAVVGSRKPTPQGLETGRRFARELSSRGWTVVSGLATGIDGAAHEGGLEGAAGTVAVVGTGLDQVYPRRHSDLARRVAQGGLLLSEFPIGTPPLAPNFPQRNRIIAGMAAATLVVEAALRSGSLITARLAAECGRDVMAVPGSIHAEQARGCHALIRDGAALVESIDDIEAALAPWPRRPPAQAQGRADTLVAPVGDAATASFPARTAEPHPIGGDDPDPIVRALGHDPVDLDTLMARCGHGAAAINARLIELEFEGRVARLPGGRYQRRGMA